MRLAVLTVSDGVSAGIRDDGSGDLLAENLSHWGSVERAVVADEVDAIVEALNQWIQLGIDIIVTTGGTGLSPRDVTPEATRKVLTKEAVGIAEALRMASLTHTPMGMLSRGLAGVAGGSLVVNFPGSSRACAELLPVLAPIWAHAVDIIHGVTRHEKS